MRDLNPGKSGRSGMQLFESLHRSGEFLDEPMILLNDIVEIFRAPDSDQPTPAAHHEQAIHIEQSNRIRSALVENNFVWPTVIANGFREKRSRWSAISWTDRGAVRHIAAIRSGSLPVDGIRVPGRP